MRSSYAPNEARENASPIVWRRQLTRSWTTFTLNQPITAEEIDTAGRRLKKALMERMLGAELSHHLGYRAGGAKLDNTTNHRNGTSEKCVFTDDGPVAIEVPGDREGTFEP